MDATDSKLQVFPRLVPAGDSAILIELGAEIDVAINDSVYALVEQIKRANLRGVSEFIPTYRSLLVNYDPLVTSFRVLFEQLTVILENQVVGEKIVFNPVVIELPVVYGGEAGPDIQNVADHAGLTIEQVVDIHSSVDYRVYMIGFAPGFPYLGGLDSRIATPRLKTPRILIPAGSVGIAESQTGVYPNESPGGWQIIGRTPIKMMDFQSESLTKVSVGDKVRFNSISKQQYFELGGILG
mgnify:CR=1 FL=1